VCGLGGSPTALKPVAIPRPLSNDLVPLTTSGDGCAGVPCSLGPAERIPPCSPLDQAGSAVLRIRMNPGHAELPFDVLSAG
jgi:hypothetical protein